MRRRDPYRGARCLSSLRRVLGVRDLRGGVGREHRVQAIHRVADLPCRPTGGRVIDLAEPLLTADDAAKLLGVSRTGIYELVRSRGLPHIRVGERSLRFTRDGLADWCERNSYGV